MCMLFATFLLNYNRIAYGIVELPVTSHCVCVNTIIGFFVDSWMFHGF